MGHFYVLYLNIEGLQRGKISEYSKIVMDTIDQYIDKENGDRLLLMPNREKPTELVCINPALVDKEKEERFIADFNELRYKVKEALDI